MLSLLAAVCVLPLAAGRDSSTLGLDDASFGLDNDTQPAAFALGVALSGRQQAPLLSLPTPKACARACRLEPACANFHFCERRVGI